MCILSVLHWKGLHVAAKYGVTENCHYLIEEAGVHGNTLDSHSQTVLFYSIESQAMECSEYLLSIGCSANHRNTDGRRYVSDSITRIIAVLGDNGEKCVKTLFLI